MTRLILGIDPSVSSTGAVILRDDQVLLAQRWASKIRGPERLAELDGAMSSLLDSQKVDLVAIEGYSYASPFHMSDMGEVGGVLKLAVWRFGIQIALVPPGQWRKQLFGNGNLKKELVQKEALKRYDVDFASTDVLEAWCVAMSTYRRLEGLEKPAPVRRGMPVLPGLETM